VELLKYFVGLALEFSKLLANNILGLLGHHELAKISSIFLRKFFEEVVAANSAQLLTHVNY